MIRTLIATIFALSTLIACSSATKSGGRSGSPSDTIVPGQTPSAQEPAVETKKSGASRRDSAPQKLGLILGPGGARALAHVGLLKQLDRERIPVSAIAGVEWGAMVAALYAHKGQIHDLDWKLFKLEKSSLPDISMLTGRIDSEPTKSLDGFLKQAFQDHRLERFRLSFSCPSQNLNNGQEQLLVNGLAYESLRRCVPYPPLYRTDGDWVASMAGLRAAIDEMRSNGITLILISDVLGTTGKALPIADLRNDGPSAILWLEAQRQLRQVADESVLWISLDTRRFLFHKFEARAELISAGEKSSASLMGRLAELMERE